MLSAKVLIIDDDRDILETARMFLKQEFALIHIEDTPEKIPALLKATEYDVILLDMNFKKGVNDGEEGFYWLNQILKIDSNAVVILITAYGEVDIAVKAIKNGATDFVLKPWKNQKLMATILAALQLRKSKKEVEKLKETQEKLSDDLNNRYTDFIGESPAIARVHELIDRVATADADVLILGENGTGKELVARAIHHKSLRKNNVFINVDLGAISETLFESELFGHVKGAFTDAKQDKAGRFELASGGTLFLDEIGNLSLPLQSKLLTVLQHRSVQRVGSAKPIPVDFRLVCATNMPLHEMVFEKKFRQDLLYRINTVEIRVPSLRERIEDIPLLAEHFLSRYSQKYKRPGMKLDKAVITKLKKYHWPGNIRELQHAIERAVILNEGKIIESAELLISGVIHTPRKEVQPQTLDEMEKQFIVQSLQDNQGNVSNTARALGLTRTALYRRMKRHGI
ncbi:sigma-54-dependent transcriptional regulator [Ohtaekwangia koreensis]|uniref:DNA-binding transcriptional response regulator, NtrC family, contains REC, AAA-type ATPase, and a Fis-type DNA-binding domains n=1 Tax=Ohtaekwangia koreensis TaxID=688867 RepID=A0A1T5JAA5_9BACT|nr:sigma-54 dependent transcriptional regulator [Ohtaekwangia koreensis]SKC48467.1 DNA-binding transcriptional response regulator, NtrC family, contains REC, AAA-type ATPase, and a Fis-type DNA-binding domains [Ohtaekwangia koreensis]